MDDPFLLLVGSIVAGGIVLVAGREQEVRLARKRASPDSGPDASRTWFGARPRTR